MRKALHVVMLNLFQHLYREIPKQVQHDAVRKICLLPILLFYPIYSNAQTDTTQAGKLRWHYQNSTTGLTEKGQYKDGKRTGLWQFYNAKGKLVKREKYKQGQFWWAIYYKENGKVAYSIDRKGKVVKRSDCGC